MAIDDLERARTDRLAEQMIPALRAGLAGPGYYSARVDEVEDVDRWRRAARKCARQLGIKVRTAVSTDGATVWVVDVTPSTPAQRAAALNVIADLVRR